MYNSHIYKNTIFLTITIFFFSTKENPDAQTQNAQTLNKNTLERDW